TKCSPPPFWTKAQAGSTASCPISGRAGTGYHAAVAMDDPAARACAHINAIGIALPPHEAHAAFLAWAERRITNRRDLALFRRMASRSGIERRWTVLPPAAGGDQTGNGGFYARDAMPPTSARMAVYADAAPDLCVRAVATLGEC